MREWAEAVAAEKVQRNPHCALQYRLLVVENQNRQQTIISIAEKCCFHVPFGLKRTEIGFWRTSSKFPVMKLDQRKRIVLIDDHLVVRQGLEQLLNFGEEFVVCEEAGDAASGMALVREMQPDGVVVDVQLPDTDGIELTKCLLGEFPHMVVIILSAYEEPEMALRAMHAGAMAYVLKADGIESLNAALRDAFNRRRNFALLEKFGGIA